MNVASLSEAIIYRMGNIYSIRQSVKMEALKAYKFRLSPSPAQNQMCSGCDEVVKKDLSDRVHNCEGCGLVLDRDHNAAINILTLGLQSLGLVPIEAPCAKRLRFS
jgi:transposase